MVSSRYIVMVAIAVLILPLVIAQAVPTESDSATLQKIDQEHKATRKFISDELTRQREQFYTQFDDRAVFYEKEFFDTLDKAVMKLAMLWGAIVFVVIGLSNMLRITLERKRMRRMKETIKNELKADLYLKSAPKPTAQQQTIYDQPASNVAAYAYTAPQATLQEKDGFFARRKKRKLARQIDALQREQARQDAKAEALRIKLGSEPKPPKEGKTFAPPQTAPAQAKPQKTLTADEINRMVSEYNQELMQKYIEEQATKFQESPEILPPPPHAKVEVYH